MHMPFDTFPAPTAIVATLETTTTTAEARAANLRQLEADLRHDLRGENIEAESARVFNRHTLAEAWTFRTMWHGAGRRWRQAAHTMPDMTLRVVVALASAGSLFAAWAAAAHAVRVVEEQAAAPVAERRAA